VDVGLDQPRRHQAAAEVERLVGRPRHGVDRDDPVTFNGDVDQALPVGQAGAAQQQVDRLAHPGTVQSPSPVVSQ